MYLNKLVVLGKLPIVAGANNGKIEPNSMNTDKIGSFFIFLNARYNANIKTTIFNAMAISCPEPLNRNLISLIIADQGVKKTYPIQIVQLQI